MTDCWPMIEKVPNVVTERISKWQPIETAPKDIRILGWDGGEIVTLDWDGRYWVQVSNSGRASCYEPTHWMMLPASPSEVA